MGHVVPLGQGAAHAPHGIQQGGGHQDGQEHQEDGIQSLADVHDQFGGFQRKQQPHPHEYKGKDCQQQRLLADKRSNPDLVGDGGRPGQSEGRTDGQIQQYRKDFGKGRMHIPGQLFQAGAA